MKKVNVALALLCAITVNSYADKPVTNTEIKASYPRPASEGGPEDKYGNTIRYQEISIKTPSLKIKNFWSRFEDPDNKESEFKNITTTGLFKLTIEKTFACQKAGLDDAGCSGQKPFLINEGYATNAELKVDAQGNALPAGEYRIPYDSADNYNVANKDAFYALDVYRAPKYYKHDEPPVAGDKKSFFDYIRELFNNYFSPATATYGDPLSPGEVDAKDRYIANIIYGFDQKHRVEKNHPVSVNLTNAADASGTISLLDYNAQTIKTSSSCSGFFLTYNSSSASCKIINFFGMANWMPFFSNNSRQEINVKSVMQDTENTLLTIAGNLDDENYIINKTQVDAQGRRSFLGEIFKPMTTVMGSMFRFFFGSSSKTTTEIISANFDFKNHMPLTFLLTNGSTITGFDDVELLGLESVYGTEATSCKVKKKDGLFGLGSKTYTFTQGVPQTIDFDGGKTRKRCSDDDEVSDYNLLNRTSSSYHDHCGYALPWNYSNQTEYTIHVTTEDWLDWCKRNQGRQKKGLFGRIFDTFTNIGNFLLGSSGKPAGYDNQLDTLLSGSNFLFFSNDNFSVIEYKEKVHRGLILHVKKINNEDIDISTVGTTTKYDLMSTKKTGKVENRGNAGKSGSAGKSGNAGMGK